MTYFKKEDLKITYSPPTPADYLNLRVESGMSGKSMEAASIGLRNSLFAVAVYNESTLVAMGRIVGDGGAFFQIVDIQSLSARAQFDRCENLAFNAFRFHCRHEVFLGQHQIGRAHV